VISLSPRPAVTTRVSNKHHLAVGFLEINISKA
jgi:hypothetical protein